MPMGRTGADAVAIVNLASQPFDGLKKRTARVTITYRAFDFNRLPDL